MWLPVLNITKNIYLYNNNNNDNKRRKSFETTVSRVLVLTRPAKRKSHGSKKKQTHD